MLNIKFEQIYLLVADASKTAGWEVNSVDPDQMLHSLIRTYIVF